MQCSYTSEPYSTLVLCSMIFLAVYVFGIPVMFGVLLRINKKRIMDDDAYTLSWLGFFYENYNKRFYYFETVWIIRSLLLSFAISFFEPSNPAQPLIILTVLYTSLLLNYFRNIFKMPMENNLHGICIIIILLTYQLSIMDYSITTSSIAMWTISIMNAAVVLTVLVTLIWHRIVGLAFHKKQM